MAGCGGSDAHLCQRKRILRLEFVILAVRYKKITMAVHADFTRIFVENVD